MGHHPVPWFDDFVGVAYRYYDLRMNIVPLFTDKREASSLWYDTIHPWVDPAIKVRFVEQGDRYWFVMGSETQKPDTNLAFFKQLAKSGHYERFKAGHGGEAYLRLGIYRTLSLNRAKKGDLCACGHEARDHDEGDGDACLYKVCTCKQFSSFQVDLLKRKKTITDIRFLPYEEARDDPLAWNCISTHDIS